MNNFTRSDIKKFIHGTMNNQLLCEGVNFLGNKIEVKDGELVFNDKTFKLNAFKTVFGVAAPIPLNVKSISVENQFLKIILIHPITGDDIPVVFKDVAKRDQLISMLEKGENFNFKTIDKDNEEKQIGFSIV